MALASVIGRGTVVRGNVRGEGNLEILGRVEGDVTVDGDLVLGEEAVVRGNLSGAQLTVAGTVQGDLRGSESLLVERGARVLGDLSSPRIGIAPGALVRGNVRTDGEPPLGQAQPQRRGATQPLRGSAPQTHVAALRAASSVVSPASPAHASPAHASAARGGSAQARVEPLKHVPAKPAPAPAPAREVLAPAWEAAPAREPVREAVPAVRASSEESEVARPPAQRERAEAPAPIVPALGKNTRAKKKRREG